MVGPVITGKPARDFSHPSSLVSGPFQLLIQRECKINIVQDRPALSEKGHPSLQKDQHSLGCDRLAAQSTESRASCGVHHDVRIGSPAVSTPFGSSGQRSASANPAVPQLGFGFISARRNLRIQASKAVRVNCSNQAGAVLNILANREDDACSPTMIGKSSCAALI